MSWATVVNPLLPRLDIGYRNRVVVAHLGPHFGRDHPHVQHEVQVLESQPTQLGLEVRLFSGLLDDAAITFAVDCHRQGMQ